MPKVVFWCPQERAVKGSVEATAGQVISSGDLETVGAIKARSGAPAQCYDCGALLFLGIDGQKVSAIEKAALSPLVGTYRVE
jgi:hypothetical protein